MAWNFLLYYFNHSAQQIWSDGIHRKRRGKGKKKGRNERIHAPVDRGKRFSSLSLSLPPSPFFIIPATYTYSPGLVALSFQRLYAPTMGRRTEVSIPSPSSIPFFFSSLFHDHGVLHHWQGKVFTRETFSLSRPLPCFTRLGHGAGRGYRFELPETAPSNGAKHIFPPSPCLAPLSAPASDVFPARRRDERPFFLLLRGVNLPRN